MFQAKFIGCAVFIAGLMASPVAQAEWSGAVGLSSDNIERGVSQSDRSPTLSANLAWRHAAGVYASLGASNVSREQYVGSDGYKLMPELGWSTQFGQPGDGRAGLFLRGQYFPGARGAWFGSLPPPAQNRVLQSKESNYGTLEVGGSLGWKVFTFSLTRSLTDYLGLAATETGPLGDRVIQSKGTVYVGLDFDWPLNESVSLNGGVGRLNVPNFEALNYTDWRAGVSAQAWGLRWGLQASGSNANGANYRLRSRRTDGGSGAANTALVASVSWVF
jgi:Bacterial protein of unknown function (Gcw_chp)